MVGYTSTAAEPNRTSAGGAPTVAWARATASAIARRNTGVETVAESWPKNLLKYPFPAGWRPSPGDVALLIELERVKNGHSCVRGRPPGELLRALCCVERNHPGWALLGTTRTMTWCEAIDRHFRA